MAVAVVFAIPLGIIAAARAGTGIDRMATTLALVGISMPNFWLGPLLAIVFSVSLGWLPVSGRGTLAHLVLPSITLGAPLAAVLARMTRASVIEELRELYVLAARARGVSRARAILRHAFRNSLIPIVTVLGLQIGAVLTGAVITETIFAWPGVGRLLIQSISFRDYPMVQGCILLIAITYVSMNLLTDVVYGLLDPRTRHSGAGAGGRAHFVSGRPHRGQRLGGVGHAARRHRRLFRRCRRRCNQPHHRYASGVSRIAPRDCPRRGARAQPGPCALRAHN